MFKHKINRRRWIFMLFGVVTKPDDDWWIGRNTPDIDHLNKLESLMFQGNGYFGIRSSVEEHYMEEKRDMFVLGTFDKYEDEATELPNLPDIVNFEIKVDGHVLKLNHGQVSNFQRSFNIRNGEMTRSFIWKFEGNEYKLKFRRFVSMAHLHLFVSKVEITPLANNVRIQIKSGIDGQQTNEGTQHLIEGTKRLFNARFIQMQTRTQESKVKFALTEYHRLYLNKKELSLNPHLKLNRRQVYANYSVDLDKEQTLSVVKYANIYTSKDRDLKINVSADSLANLKKISRLSYASLMLESSEVWNKKYWNKSYVEISAHNNKPQIAINFARYQLIANTPHDFEMNIGAKGMTGEGYKGHTFWDTEMFMLPYFIFTLPQKAYELLEYRYLGLIGAKRKAHQGGFHGAQYPWEAAMPEDAESAPIWGNADIVTGQPMKILSGFLEQHVTGDVAYGVMRYLKATGDQSFANRMGYEIILQCAKFWASRVEWNNEKNRYEITDVIGPDEYKEHVSNDAFTNYIAHWCMEYGADIIAKLRQENTTIYDQLNQKLSLSELFKALIQKASMMYVPKPNDDQIIPQDDNYLSYKIIDVTKYKNAEKDVEDVSEIFKDFDLKQLDRMQVTKQPDVLLMMLCFEELFSKEVIQKNWDYYEPKTTHDSSLSYSPHAILANDLGLYDKAFEYFEKSCQVDLGMNMDSSVKGTHMAAMGGIWNVIVEGFGGVRVVPEGLRIQPHIPDTWTSLKFMINWRGAKVRIHVTHDNFSILSNKKLQFINYGQNYQIEPQEKMEIPLKK
ncbi:MAG TPA: family 65 glycosyl hydrolase [Lactobacillus sp.]|nr:family 65 glycosyl hydrolase [Lactobacillus sp.]